MRSQNRVLHPVDSLKLRHYHMDRKLPRGHVGMHACMRHEASRNAPGRMVLHALHHKRVPPQLQLLHIYNTAHTGTEVCLGVACAQVLPITVYHSDYVLEQRRQIAVNARFICYALKQGHIRVLSTQSAHRSLIKAHKPPLTDLQCAFNAPVPLSLYARPADRHCFYCILPALHALPYACMPDWPWC